MPTHYEGEESVRRALDAYLRLSRARKVMGDETSRFLAEYGLTESQFGTLEAIYHLGPMYQAEIGEKLLVSAGNMTMVISNLERQGLVCRERYPQDRRQITVSLTDEGHQLIRDMFPDHAQKIADLMGVLCPEEQEELGRLCQILGKQSREE